jgi:GT2 family glycosyltransferase
MSNQIQAVLVLYRMRLQDSGTYAAWNAAAFSAMADLMVCDNTPGTPGAPPGDFHGPYLAQPDNPGLAKSYNLALQRADHGGATWLMLLDQDTHLTANYFDEVGHRAAEFADDKSVVAIVPKLVENGVVQSPHMGICAKTWTPLPPDTSGLLENRGQHIYNSGALMRVSSLLAIGGFPEDFWLDYLDHAIFHQLREHGGRVFLMNASIHHTLSSNAAPEPNNPAYLARHANVLAAEALYYRRYGTPLERWWYRRRLLRATANAAIRRRHFRLAWRTLKAALQVRLNG